MNRRAKILVILSVIVLVLIGAAILAGRLIVKYTPSKVVMDLAEYYDIPDDEMMIILEDSVYEENALYENGQIYVSLDLLVTKLDGEYYWDEKENLLIFTTPDKVIKAEVGDDFYYSNKTKQSVEYDVLKAVGGKFYVAMDFIILFSDITYQKFENPNRVIIQYTWTEHLYSDVTKATQMRTNYGIKSDILVELETGDKVMYVDAGGIQKEGFVKVMTADGIRGYVQTKALSESYYFGEESTYEEPVYTHITSEHSINLVWHMTLEQDSNQYFMELINRTDGVSTVAPTWFNVNSEDGTLDSRADAKYVDEAHGLGMEVWAVISNFSPSSETTVEVDDYKLLSTTASRETLVNEIVAAAIKYNLDGINIDFEGLSSECGPHFIQFLRELSIKCRQNRIVLSVDNYIPASYNAFYDLEEQAKYIDYVVIMGYDEHYDGSEEAGSVSSIGFINDAIAATLEQVPAGQIIMGIPFYTRLWKETTTDGTAVLTSEALGMEAAEKFLETNGVSYDWDETTGQFYAEFEKENVTYKIWLEEELSIEEKMKAIYNAELAGVAEWRIGFEKETVWNVIERYLK